MQVVRAVVVVLLMLCGGTVRGQWEAGFSAGVALPGAASSNAPQVRASWVGGLTASYQLPSHPRWRLRADLWGLRQLAWDSPDVKAVPLDADLHVVYHQHVPLTVGLDYCLPLAKRWRIEASCGVGGYWRFINCQRLLTNTLISNYNDHGLGFALQAGVGVVFASRLALKAHVVAMGNPFEPVGEGVPAAKAATLQYNLHDIRLKGYGQLFFMVGLGYRIPFSKQ